MPCILSTPVRDSGQGMKQCGVSNPRPRRSNVLPTCAACRWLAEYAQLMRILRADAGRVWSSAAELFELYLLHTYATFADVGLMDVLGRGGATSRGLGLVTLFSLHHSLALLGMCVSVVAG